MMVRKLKAVFGALLVLVGSHAGAANVDGVIVEDKASEWLSLVDAAKYDEASTWLAGLLGIQASFEESAAALRELHAQHGPTFNRRLSAKEIETPRFDRSFQVKVTTTFINNATAQEVVYIGLADGHWKIHGHEVIGSED